ncbi:MAG: hypothetical protein RL071_4606, partial [Pseudomonadota bacterium]
TEDDAPDVVPAPAPAPAPSGDGVADARPRPAPAPAPEPASAPAPRPTPGARRVIEVLPEDGGATPTAAPAPAPAEAAPTGTVRVRTVPSGATVTVRGRPPAAAPGGGYTLPVGQHTVELTSPAGERTRLAVSVRAGQTVSLCWSFDANAACGDAP